MALVVQQRLGSVGLPLAYFLALSLIHVPGALLYLERRAQLLPLPQR